MAAFHQLPQLDSVACNKCGECCTHGGECTLRGPKTNWKFEGRCNLLIDGDNGTKLCSVMLGKTDKMLRSWNIKGICNFTEWKKELG